jgi:hypothetical protein
MIRILAAVAAFAVLPTLAVAQSTPTASEVVVSAARADKDTIVIPVAGKDEKAVRAEIWQAVYTVCQRLPVSSNLADNTVDGWITCVNEAQWDAISQYRNIQNHL